MPFLPPRFHAESCSVTKDFYSSPHRDLAGHELWICGRSHRKSKGPEGAAAERLHGRGASRLRTPGGESVSGDQRMVMERACARSAAARAPAASRRGHGAVARPAPRFAGSGQPTLSQARRQSPVVARAVDMFVEEETTLNIFQTILLVMGGAAGIAAGIAVPRFYQVQSDASEERPNTQPCFVCEGTGETMCRFCDGSGQTTMTLGSGETKTQECINCSGRGTIVCTTCNGTGIQPRYLDRRCVPRTQEILSTPGVQNVADLLTFFLSLSLMLWKQGVRGRRLESSPPRVNDVQTGPWLRAMYGLVSPL